ATGVTWHTAWEAISHNNSTVISRVDTDNIRQISWAHWPAELALHYFIDAGKINAFINHAGEACKVREQHAIHQEARAVINNNGCFAHARRISDNSSNSFV